MKILSLALRPTKLSRMIGQEAVVASIRNRMAKRPPQSWMFIGDPGCGKTTIARIMAVSFQCGHMAIWGDPCPECWKARSSFNIHEINASEVSGVKELGEVAEVSRMQPMEGAKRVIILDEFQKVSKDAQNLLLKPFEEPPEKTIWIICTTDPSKILPALKRRLTTLQLKALKYSAVEKFVQGIFLKHEIKKPSEPLIEQLHLANVGTIGVILQAIESYASGLSSTDSVWGTDGQTNSLALCKAITAGKWGEARTILKEVTPDEARWLRASVAGWIRGILNRETNFKILDKAATSLIDLTTYANDTSQDNGTLLLWLYGVLFKICMRFRTT